MRLHRILLLTLVGLGLAAAFGQAATLRYGDRGQAVLVLQENLAQLGYFTASPTGYYGRLTRAAVTAFQRAVGLTPDGVAGPRTQEAIEGHLARLGDQLASRGGGTVTMLPWDLVNPLWPRETTARIYDVETGLSLVVWRLYGTYHADVEPLTSYDTYQLKRIYGNRWSWARRAIIVELRGRYIAASMNGMPHGYYRIKDNDFPGQFCIHFLGSRLHKNRQVDADHQAMVLKAARTGLRDLIRPADESAVEESPGDEEERSQAVSNPPEIE